MTVLAMDASGVEPKPPSRCQLWRLWCLVARLRRLMARLWRLVVRSWAQPRQYPLTAVLRRWPGLLPPPPVSGISLQAPGVEAAAVWKWGSVDTLGDGGSPVLCPRSCVHVGACGRKLWQVPTRFPGPLVI